MLEVVSLCSAVPALEAESGQTAHVGHPDRQRACRQVNFRIMALEHGKDFIPTRQTLKSTENICNQMTPIGFAVVVKLNANMHIGIL